MGLSEAASNVTAFGSTPLTVPRPAFQPSRHSPQASRPAATFAAHSQTPPVRAHRSQVGFIQQRYLPAAASRAFAASVFDLASLSAAAAFVGLRLRRLGSC